MPKDKSNPRKRPRRDEPAVTTVCVPTLWFEDGNIVLRAGRYAFKLHRSLLSRHSKVFRDMFEVSQPGEGDDDEIEGAPVVDLHDSSNDLKIFLRLIYDGMSFTAQGKPTWAIVRAGYLLGHKYQVENLTREARRYLEIFLSGDIHQWDQATKDPPFSYTNEDLLSIAKTTQGVQALHQKALYRCAVHLRTLEILRGVEGSPEDRHHIGRIAAARCIDMQFWLFSNRNSLYEVCRAAEPRPYLLSTCRSGRMCDWNHILRTLGPNPKFQGRGPNPLSPSVEFIESIFPDPNIFHALCNSCREDMQHRADSFRQKLLKHDWTNITF